MRFQGGSENMLLLHPQGNIEGYYDNVKRLETTSTGITVTNTSATAQIR